MVRAPRTASVPHLLATGSARPSSVIRRTSSRGSADPDREQPTSPESEVPDFREAALRRPAVSRHPSDRTAGHARLRAPL